MFKKYASQLALVFAALLLLTACGQSTDPGSTPEETGKALIAAFEASDTAALSKLYTAETMEAFADTGFSLEDLLAQTTKMYGAPLKDQGRVLQSAQSSNGKYALVELAIVYDGKCSPCSTPDNEQPDWAPQGSKVVISEGALRKESDGKWLGHTTAPGVPSFKEQRAAAAQATSNAAAAPTSTALALVYIATSTARADSSIKTATAQVEAYQATEVAYQQAQNATATAYAASQRATAQVVSASQTAVAAATATQAPLAAARERRLDLVAMTGLDEGWVVGDRGLIAHYKNGSWSRVTGQTEANLLTIQMLSPTDGFAAGREGTILQLLNGGWQRLSSPIRDAVFDISMLTAKEGWAVGENRKSILHFTGGRWVIEVSPLEQAGLTPYGIAMISPTDGWIVGQNGVLVHYDGVSWQLSKSPVEDGRDLYAVVFSGPNEGWAVGEAGLLLHFHDGVWEVAASPTNRNLYGLYFASRDDGWSVGLDGTILQYQAGSWRTVGSPTDRNLYGVQMISASDGWIVGGSDNGPGIFLRYQNGLWGEYLK